MKYKFGLLLLAAGVFALAACNKEDESPFAGSDNYITAFTLQTGSVTLKAAITSGAIALSAPEQLLLAGATAAVTLSENATIEPNPATITDWDAAHTFTVTAWDGAKNTYAYSVERYMVERDGDVTLLTQADVEAFAADLDADQINGTLTIGAATGQDSVYSLAGLEKLKVISGGVIINATYAGEALTAFESLERTGTLMIKSNKVKTVRFPRLAAVRLDFEISHSASLHINSLEFPELVTVDKGMRIQYPDSLESISFPKLEQVVEDMIVMGHYGGASILQTLEFPALERVSGTATIYYFQQLERLDFPKLTAAGAITVSNMDNLKFLTADRLETVGGALSVGAGCDKVAELGLHSLKAAGTLTLDGLANITAVDVRGIKINRLTLQGNLPAGLTLTGDEEFPGALYFGSPSGSATLSVTVEGIKRVGELTVTPASGYTGALELSGLKHITRLLNISGSNRYLPANISAVSLPHLESTGGLQISYCDALTALHLPELKEITGYTSGTATLGGFTYAVTSSKINALSFPALQSIEGNVSITGLAATYNLGIISFPVLQSLTGTLTITGTNNATFKDLSGFSALTSAGGVTITNFTQLKDFSPLQHLFPALPADKWTVTGCGYDPTHQNMLDGIYSN